MENDKKVTRRQVLGIILFGTPAIPYMVWELARHSSEFRFKPLREFQESNKILEGQFKALESFASNPDRMIRMYLGLVFDSSDGIQHYGVIGNQTINGAEYTVFKTAEEPLYLSNASHVKEHLITWLGDLRVNGITENDVQEVRFINRSRVTPEHQSVLTEYFSSLSQLQGIKEQVLIKMQSPQSDIELIPEDFEVITTGYAYREGTIKRVGGYSMFVLPAQLINTDGTISEIFFDLINRDSIQTIRKVGKMYESLDITPLTMETQRQLHPIIDYYL